MENKRTDYGEMMAAAFRILLLDVLEFCSLVYDSLQQLIERTPYLFTLVALWYILRNLFVKKRHRYKNLGLGWPRELVLRTYANRQSTLSRLEKMHHVFRIWIIHIRTYDDDDLLGVWQP